MRKESETKQKKLSIVIQIVAKVPQSHSFIHRFYAIEPPYHYYYSIRQYFCVNFIGYVENQMAWNIFTRIRFN